MNSVRHWRIISRDTLRFCSRLKSSHQSQTSISIFFLFLSIPNDQDFPLHTHDQPLQLATNDQSFHAEESASDRIDISIHISLFELLFCLGFFSCALAKSSFFLSLFSSLLWLPTFTHSHILIFTLFLSTVCPPFVLQLYSQLTKIQFLIVSIVRIMKMTNVIKGIILLLPTKRKWTLILMDPFPINFNNHLLYLNKIKNSLIKLMLFL